MKRQIPNNVHVVLEQSQVNPNRIVIVDLTERITGNQFANLAHRSRVNKRVIDHEYSVAFLCFVDQTQCLFGVCRQGLFNQYMFVGPERGHRQIEV